MPQSRYINVTIDGQRLDLESAEEFPISISYKLEDPENFQSKKSTEAFNVKVPATLDNDVVGNTFHNPGIEDLTADNVYRRHRRVVVEANGIELVVGKAFMINARHASCPISYEYNFYGNNGDWMIDLKEKTLFDFLRHISFEYSKDHIMDSWGFDGTDENLPYVFAPVRYGLPMEGGFTNLVMDPPPYAEDWNMTPTYMKPALSKYWLLYWGFKSVGYRIASDFFDTSYFRRQVMPWTWGNFNFVEGSRLDNLDFLAKSTQPVSMANTNAEGPWNLLVSNDSTNGAFDNNGVYEYDTPTREMKWTYLPAFDYGHVDATVHLQVAVTAKATVGSFVQLRVQWFKNGVQQNAGNGDTLMTCGPDLIRADFSGLIDVFYTKDVDPGDTIGAKIWIKMFNIFILSTTEITASVDAFELEYIRVPLGGTTDFENFSFLNKWKWLDFLRGVIDEFNLTIQTDAINKVVYIEPTHPYALESDQSIKIGGYFNGKYLDWEEKQELLKESELPLVSDSERELIFKYKEDSNDGLLKLVQDRNVNMLAAGKYVLPDRFKSGKKEYENRFFSPTMHCDMAQWKSYGTISQESPQMVCLIPENISNTSQDGAQNTFSPKSCYYKGTTTDWGWVFDGDKGLPYPYMFAVNYKRGGEEDPILSYSDERIGITNSSISGIGEIGVGLLRRFYHQRLAIMRNGQAYNTFFKLNNIDITNWLHREHIICRGQKWELVEIKDYKPLAEETTGVYMRKWSPIIEADKNNTFPSEDEVMDNTITPAEFDIPYAQLKCLANDIPTK